MARFIYLHAYAGFDYYISVTVLSSTRAVEDQRFCQQKVPQQDQTVKPRKSIER